MARRRRPGVTRAAALLAAGPGLAGPLDPTIAPVVVPFAEGSPDIPDSAKPRLPRMARRLAADEAARGPLLACAGGGQDRMSQARRLSPSRALAARGCLVARGLAGSRVDLRARGGAAAGEPADRVDIVPQQ